MPDKHTLIREIIEKYSQATNENFILRQRIRELERGWENMQPAQPTQSPALEWNKHDIKVIIFQLVVAVVQALLLGLSHFTYGPYTPDVVLLIQVLAEAVRRLVVS